MPRATDTNEDKTPASDAPKRAPRRKADPDGVLDAAKTQPKVASTDKSAGEDTVKPDSGVNQTQAADPGSPSGRLATGLSALKRLPRPGRPKVPSNWRTIALRVGTGIVAVTALIVIVFGVLIYGYRSEDKVVSAVSSVIPYPAARVNGQFVTYHDYLFRLNFERRAQESQAKLSDKTLDWKSDDGKKLLASIRTNSLESVKANAVASQIANERGVKVTKADVDKYMDQLYKQNGSKDKVEEVIGRLYGWNINDLRAELGRQILLQKVSESVTSDEKSTAQVKAKAADVAAKAKAGADFAELAKQYSQASDAASGGDLGTFTKGQGTVPDEIQAAVDNLAVGDVSDPVKDAYGYEVLKVTEKNGDQIRASHILFKTLDFNEYLDKQIKDAKYKQYIKV